MPDADKLLRSLPWIIDCFSRPESEGLVSAYGSYLSMKRVTIESGMTVLGTLISWIP